MWWGHTTDEEFGWYTSEPLCLNDDFTIIKRSCENGTWDEEPYCVSLQKRFTPCPENFTYHENTSICYVIVSNQTYPASCPYSATISFYDYVSLIGNEIIGPVWVPANRLSDLSLLNIVLKEPTKFFGTIVTSSYTWKGSFYKDCLVSHSSTSYELVNCNSTYDAVCAYKPLRYLKNIYCGNDFNDQCYYSDYDLSEAKCFCKHNQSESCDNLAELKKPFQNFILPPNHGDCRIGLEMQDEFLWINSKERISYSNWNYKTNFSKRYGVLTEESSWTLTNENEWDCVLCEETLNYQKTTLSLSLDLNSKRLVLTVSNPEYLYVPDNSDGIFCFTDTAAGTSQHPYSSISYDYSETFDNATKYYFSYSANCPGHYWCRAFAYPNLNLIKSERLLVYDEDIYGNEFAMTFLIEYNSSVDPTRTAFYGQIRDAVNERLSGSNETLPFSMRWVTMINVDENARVVEYLVHVTSKKFADVEVEYEEFKKLISSAVGEVASIQRMNQFKSVSYCLPDTTELNGNTLQWPLTKINSTVTPAEFCLHKDGSPVTRTCVGDFFTGAYWSSVLGSCAADPKQSPITAELYKLMQLNATLSEKSDSLVEITKNVSEYIPVDIHFIAEIFEKSDKEEVTNIENVTTVIDNIIGTQRATLEQSQVMLNSTDRILYNFDVLLQTFIAQHTRSAKSTIEQIITKNLIVFVFDAKRSNIRGIALYNRDGKKEVVKLRGDDFYTNVFYDESLEVAAYIPPSLIEQINQTISEDQPLIVIMTVFLNDLLFNEYPCIDSAQAYKSVFGILLPTIDEAYTSSIKIVYKFPETDTIEQCAYWRYGFKSEFENIKGQWEFQKRPISKRNIRVCDFEHTTHFGLLVLANVSPEEQENYAKHDTVLHIITAIETTFSVVGIFCIFTTAALFRRWRQNKGNRILLHYSIVTLLQLILLFLSSGTRTAGSAEEICIIVGVCLHYIVLSQFCWMLVMAILHYQRFVLVFDKPKRCIVLKACLVGYGLPLIPVTINLTTLTPYNYVTGNTGMCYPSGISFTIWLLVPVLFIATMNLAIFCVIIWNIFHEKASDMYGHDFILVLKLRLVAVLFSLLGITWIFGFAAEFLSSIAFAYLFTITGSIQGFVMFLAFIVLNDSTRNMYFILFMKSYKYRKWQK